MSQQVSPLAGKPAPTSILVDVSKLLTACADLKPDPTVQAQRVAFGTSGHRGSSFERSFNEWHILAMSQAICEYRKSRGIDGPLFIGADTHALQVERGHGEVGRGEGAIEHETDRARFLGRCRTLNDAQAM